MVLKPPSPTKSSHLDGESSRANKKGLKPPRIEEPSSFWGFLKNSLLLSLVGFFLILSGGCYSYSYYDPPPYSYGESAAAPFSESLKYDDPYYYPPSHYYAYPYPYYSYPYYPYYSYYPYYPHPYYYPYPYFFGGYFHFHSHRGNISPPPRRSFQSGGSGPSSGSPSTSPPKNSGRVFK